jgi:hypothetical protein
MARTHAFVALAAAILLLWLSHVECDFNSPRQGTSTGLGSAPSSLRGGFSGIAAFQPQQSGRLAAQRTDLRPPPSIPVGSSTIDSIISANNYQLDVEAALAKGQAEPEDLARSKVLSATIPVNLGRGDHKLACCMAPHFELSFASSTFSLCFVAGVRAGSHHRSLARDEELSICTARYP